GADGVADQLLRAFVAGGGVDEVDAVIEEIVEDVGDAVLVRLEVADGGAAEAEGGDLEIGPAEGDLGGADAEAGDVEAGVAEGGRIHGRIVGTGPARSGSHGGCQGKILGKACARP